MHPAASVVFFTTASGAGYGMLALLGLLVPFGLLPADRWFGGISLALGLGLVTLGLLSSTLHLHHPERAWRAFSQWRSSWLSREGVVAIITFAPVVGFAAGWLYFGSLSAAMGLLVSVFAVLTIFCTSMIYASLKTIPQWHHRLVPPVYLILGVATGAVWLVGVAAGVDAVPTLLVDVALAALVFAAGAKTMYWHSIDNTPTHSDTGTATGLGHLGTVRHLEGPHGVENWVLREMGFSVARKHTRRLRRIAGILGFAVPALCLIAVAANIAPVALAWLAVASVSIGVIVERWLFFAEARHVVGLYYGLG